MDCLLLFCICVFVFFCLCVCFGVEQAHTALCRLPATHIHPRECTTNQTNQTRNCRVPETAERIADLGVRETEQRLSRAQNCSSTGQAAAACQARPGKPRHGVGFSRTTLRIHSRTASIVFGKSDGTKSRVDYKTRHTEESTETVFGTRAR